jgi:membrane-bound ClpP family serine protease
MVDRSFLVVVWRHWWLMDSERYLNISLYMECLRIAASRRNKILDWHEGVAEERIAPSGYIRVSGELWQSEVMGKKTPIEKGETVLVKGAYGLTLLVQPTQKR